MPPKKEHDRFKELSYLKEQEQESCCSGNFFFSEEENSPRSEGPAGARQPEKDYGPRSEKPQTGRYPEEANRSRSEKPQKGSQDVSEIAENAERDLIAAAILKSGGDGKYVESLLRTRETDRSQLSTLQRVLRHKPREVIINAVEAMKQQEHNVREPAKWLLRALRGEWKPNVAPEQEKEVIKTPERVWADVAHSRQIVQFSYTRKIDGCEKLIVQQGDYAYEVETAMRRWPLDWIERIPKDLSSLVQRLITSPACRSQGELEELAQYGIKGANGNLEPAS